MTKQATKKQEHLFEFLKEHKSFSVEDLVHATDYKQSTVETYIRKNLLRYLIKSEAGRYKITKELQDMKLEKFIKHMDQTSRKCRKQN